MWVSTPHKGKQFGRDFGQVFQLVGATRRPLVDLAKLKSGAGWQGFGWVFGSCLPPLVGVNLSNSWGDWLGLSVGLVGSRLVGHWVIVNWHKVTELKGCYALGAPFR